MPVVVIQVRGGLVADATTDIEGLDVIVIQEDDKVIDRAVPVDYDADPRQIVGEALVSGFEDLDEEVANG
jgi:hypothetical protein